ncbi:hypothetical protein OH802_05695 [Nocardioides sp. NBC_00850]|uniref:hypothetical protein n=1 Tax=Nocardioides sp. NBC_00850 TaxID=2976001 RepID=UPI003865441C|nr:hypothetical protein OH802_05695 [Nocardioides sp. NBC_00850]
MDSSQWSALFSGASAVAAIVTAVVAGWALNQQRKDSHDQARPVVIATLRPGPRTSHGSMYLIVKNAGASLARRVRVTFSPTLPTAEIASSGQPAIAGPFITRRYAEAIPVLGPGEALNNIYCNLTHDDEGIPHQVTVAVSYEDDRGRTYTDTYPLDLDIYRLETFSSPGDTDYSKRVAKATEAMTWEAWADRL